MGLLYLIERKRDGHRLEADDWESLTRALESGALASYQLAALNVAASIKGLSETEVSEARAACEKFGIDPDRLQLPDIGVDDSLLGGSLKPSSDSIHAILRKKITGECLSKEEIDHFISGVTDLSVSADKIAAFCMAVFLQGMTRDETVALTRAMLHSGEVLDWDGLPGPFVDKHSTGGVGDKVSLPLAGVLAACGLYVPMISGRGLGHTGGTLDKLEAIPNYRIDLRPDEMEQVLREYRAVIVGQTASLAPADRRMYAIRDVTGSVSSIPLITASILSKKLAEGISSLVLDVKVGSGAFMKTLEDARALAISLAEVGRAAGTQVNALLTSMNEPIGMKVGNALEVEESVDCLKGMGPPDLETLVVMQAAELLVMTEKVADRESGEAMARAALKDGSAFRCFKAMVGAQGGDASILDELDRFATPRFKRDICATLSGYVHWLDAESIGRAVVELGGGRRKQEDQVDPAVGIVLRRKVGEPVQAGETILELLANDEGRLDQAEKFIRTAIRVEKDRLPREALLLGRV